ncbi:hydrogenase nickel incorporation protein HypB [Shewanella sp. D64]|uniref:hydrogenase nickel incorporation protein HypB n=1 Tax=unclassified Shewanella TaxID=196818 RepID=UPI0022BA40D6|nr:MULTISPECIES: hydrogenase nickel incorporation protein HypB [unclassified Shewanella]MEC4725376.1 hydrogenase nickel incorporation protein HypB [Shewanella sp. D64]MEC4735778.1 hydrogenase nickel incorporation protein HypB [Shewanella sp. E94]WBJ93250.1 hydrogenase nickel incorporation protein HypB [Shewanella sp. MTB7]
MCKDCGCSLTRPSHKNSGHAHEHNTHSELHSNPQLNDKKTLSVIHKILDKNDVEAGHNRAHFNAHGVTAFNMMSSPGSGKTTLLEHLHEYTELNYAVIEGDLETSRDADRLKAKGIDAYQIQTGSACHLDAFMVHGALHHIKLDNLDICFVENVGNLVCPASYDVGTHLNIVLVSIPEGDDKVEKYPVMFRRADLILITKCDLLAHFDFSIEEAKTQISKLNPNVDVIEISVKDPDSMSQLANWLKAHQRGV